MRVCVCEYHYNINTYIHAYTQGHIGQSRTQTDDWKGGKHREEAAKAKKMKQPWWERSAPGTSYGAAFKSGSDEQQQRNGNATGNNGDDASKTKSGGER
jgi:hypothetical protein